jgi:hypothetical protein
MANITVDQMVQREVIYCVSTLISELAKQEQYQEDLFPVCAQDDWESAALEEAPANTIWHKTDESAQDFCERHSIDPHTNEAYEHWIVSGWLADRLEAEGEMVLRDFLGMTIWGRACTGQSIAMDSVIEQIHAQLIGKAV